MLKFSFLVGLKNKLTLYRLIKVLHKIGKWKMEVLHGAHMTERGDRLVRTSNRKKHWPFKNLDFTATMKYFFDFGIKMKLITCRCAH